jgi:hypothetical protein
MRIDVPREQLLLEVEQLLRIMPPRETIRQGTDENLSWLGRAQAVLENWDFTKTPMISSIFATIHGLAASEASVALRRLQTLLHSARQDLLMKTSGPTSIAVGQGMTFMYFDELRKAIELAKQELFFVDPYLDADFVSRYLPHAAAGVGIRLLAREKLKTLLPAVQAFVQQAKAKVEIRSTPQLHDRYVFIDRSSCYQSGASFKDGAKTAPTTLTQIIDAFDVVLSIYENKWSAGKVEM